MKLPRAFLVLVPVIALAVLTGCPPKPPEQVPTPPPAADEGKAVEEPPVIVPKEEGFREEQPRVETKVEPSIAEINRMGVLKTVYFDYDRSAIRDDQRAVLVENAEWLKANARYVVEVGGHCDDRGTTEYNLALGDRRANAIKDYLVGLGVDASRLEVVSYGEERPAVPGSGDETWAQNRRAEFVVLR